MASNRAMRILEEVLSLPTAPFAEHMVIDYIRKFVAARPVLRLKRDASGNLLVRFRRGSRRTPRPICMTAHLDHPGFVSAGSAGEDRVRAHWRGGVAPSYFDGAGVRFFSDGRWMRGVIESKRTTRSAGRERVTSVVARVKGRVPRGSIGMWDFPDPRVRGKCIHARACDDLAGAAALIACMDDLARSKRAGEAMFLFTRAEEVGFVGAIAACRHGTIPAKAVVVNLETSSMLAGGVQGAGPILRVGDKSSIFTPAATAYCAQVARVLSRKDRPFPFQRKLMDGGTCEASAFARLGYEATGLCLALGNYHNMDVKRKRLGPEFIHLEDYQNLVRWCVGLATSTRPYHGDDPVLLETIEKLEREYEKLLAATLNDPS